MKKIARNIERDNKVTMALSEDGWSVFVLWECSITKQFDSEMSILYDAIRNVINNHITKIYFKDS